VATWLHPPPIPREHGAWAMLVIPLVLGVAAAGALERSSLWAAAAMVLLFLARGASVPAGARFVGRRPLPAGYLPRRLVWTGIYTSGAGTCFAAALAGVTPAARETVVLSAVLPLGLGIVHSVLGLAGRDRSIVGEVIGMAGLASAAPLIVAASGGRLDRQAVGAGAFALLYFVSSLAFVRAFRGIKESGRLEALPCLVAHAGIGVGLVALYGLGFVPATALAAFVPVAVRTAWGLSRPPPNLKVLGWREVAVAGIFLVVAAAGFFVP